MKAPPFAYARAGSLADAFRLLAIEDAKPIAGGQSLLASLAFRLSQPSLLVDIARVPELGGITTSGGLLRIGALTTHAHLGRNDLVRRYAPLLANAVPLIAHAAIRNRGTIGGSLAYADPASELPACAVALDAYVVVVSTRGERRVPASQFFTGLLTTALEDGELIASVDVPMATAMNRSAIDEVARRSGDYAMAGAAVALAVEGTTVTVARPVLFGVGPGPVLALKSAAALSGKPLSVASIAAAQAALDGDLDPPADQHGGPDMKRQLARVVLGRALTRILNGAAS